MSEPAGRRAARRAAVVLLYQQDLTGQTLFEVRENARRGGEPVDDPYVSQLVNGVSGEREALDARLSGAADGWTADRLGAVERAILRVATWEIVHPEASVPVAVAINEAVALAKRYCAAEAPSFINGVLGKIAREQTAGDDA